MVYFGKSSQYGLIIIFALFNEYSVPLQLCQVIPENFMVLRSSWLDALQSRFCPISPNPISPNAGPKNPFFVSRRTSCYRRRTTCSVSLDKACHPSLSKSPDKAMGKPIRSLRSRLIYMQCRHCTSVAILFIYTSICFS